MARRLFWPCWMLAAVATGLVAGFMLGHTLVLGRFLEWMVASDPRLLATTYPVFARSPAGAGLTVFYAVCGLQVLAALALLALALGLGRHRLGAGVSAVTAVAWPVVHYASGFGALEAAALRAVTPVPAEVAAGFLAWNTPVHAAHVALLLAGLLALLAVPLAGRRAPAPGARR